MDYHIAVCDDAAPDRTYLIGLIRDWAEEAGYGLKIDEFDSAEQFAFHYAEQKDYDILFLDIEMGEMDGVTLTKRLRQDNADDLVQIVFVTGYSDYIAEGYEVAALHYLMKPVSGEKVFSVLNRAVKQLIRNGRTLLLSCSGETVRLPVNEIRYLEVHLNYVTVHAKRDYMVKKPLQEFAEELDDRFYKAGRSVIVNLTCISRVTKMAVYLTDGSTIPLPRGQYEAINRAIIAQE